MIKSFDNYTLLAGSHGRRGSIWRGPDHLLIIEGQGVLFALSESYRRIDYSNIQTISLVRTQRYAWFLAAFIAPLLLMALILMGMIGSGMDSTGLMVTIILLGVPMVLLPAVLLIMHLAKGRTVRCTLQTAVQNLRLRPLTREQKAQEVMAEITRLCREHQGEMPATQQGGIAASMQAWSGPSPTGSRPLWNGSPVALIAGVSLLLWGLLMIGELFMPGWPYLTLHVLASVTAIIAAVIALVVVLRHHSPGLLQAVLWISSAVGILLEFFLLGTFGFVGAMLQAKEGNPSPIRIIEFLGDASFAELGGFGWVIIGIGALIGLLGLVLIPYGMRRQPVAATPQSPPPMPPGISH